MVKEIVHDPILLGMESAPATKEDLQVARDLLDTLQANKDTCVGMQAFMIRRKAAFLCLAVLALASAIKPSRCNGRTSNSRPA